MKAQGQKQVREAVLIASLCSLTAGLITWGFEEAKLALYEWRRKKRKKGSKS